MRQTSIETYNQIKESGVLSRARQMVYEVIYKHGPICIFEVEAMFTNGNRRATSTISGRFSELERMGVIYDTGLKRLSSGSKYPSTVWEVTNNIPIKQEKKKTKDQIIKELKEEIANLKLHLQQNSEPYKQGLLL